MKSDIEHPHIAKMAWSNTPWIFDCEIGRRIGLLLSKHRIVDYARSPLVSTNELMSWIRCDRWGRHTNVQGWGSSGQVWEPLLCSKWSECHASCVSCNKSEVCVGVILKYFSVLSWCDEHSCDAVSRLSLQTLCSAWCVMNTFYSSLKSCK